MKRCENCRLRLKGRFFTPDLFRRVPIHLRHVFICDQNGNDNPGGDEDRSRPSLCSADLWVLTFIGQNDAFAVKNATDTLKKLVQAGSAELLCNLFSSAGYEVRRELWLYMTQNHPDRLYLFDALFEKECLAPLDTNRENLHLYQYGMLFNNSAATAMFDDLY